MSDEHTSENKSKASLEKASMQDADMQDIHAQLMREKEEPHEGFSPIPIVLLFVFAGLCRDYSLKLLSSQFQKNKTQPLNFQQK